MGAIFIANVPYSAYKELRIIKLPALRRLNMKLREDANLLQLAVESLAEEIDGLEPEADRATLVEEELRAMAAEQRVDVERVVRAVKENEFIISEMKDNLRHRIVQDVLKIVVTTDQDKDGRFSKVDTKMMVLKMHLQLQGYGVEFDEEKFYKVMNKDPTIADTIQIVKNLIPA